MEVTPLHYIGFIGFVIAMLLLDLRLFQTDEETEPTVKEAGTWVAIWVSLALAFGVGLWFLQGSEIAIQYYAGYLIATQVCTNGIEVQTRNAAGLPVDNVDFNVWVP